MKKKSIWTSLKSKFRGEIKGLGEVKEGKDWVRSQFIELTRLGNSPVTMKMGN